MQQLRNEWAERDKRQAEMETQRLQRQKESDEKQDTLRQKSAAFNERLAKRNKEGMENIQKNTRETIANINSAFDDSRRRAAERDALTELAKERAKEKAWEIAAETGDWTLKKVAEAASKNVTDSKFYSKSYSEQVDTVAKDAISKWKEEYIANEQAFEATKQGIERVINDPAGTAKETMLSYLKEKISEGKSEVEKQVQELWQTNVLSPVEAPELLPNQKQIIQKAKSAFEDNVLPKASLQSQGLYNYWDAFSGSLNALQGNFKDGVEQMKNAAKRWSESTIQKPFEKLLKGDYSEE